MIQFGAEAEVWYLPTADRPTNGPLPTWAAVDKTKLVGMCQIRQLSLQFTMQTAPATTKCDTNWTISVPLERGIGLTFEAPYDLASLGMREVWQSFFQRRNLAIVVVDTNLFSSGTIVNTNAKGVWADWIVSDISERQPIANVIRHAYTLQPALSYYVDTSPPDTEPVAIQRFFPEVLIPASFPS